MEQIERHAGGPVRVLLEVNVAGEESKYGVPLDAVDAFVERASQGEASCSPGSMTMPPFAERPEEARPYFSRLRELARTAGRGVGAAARVRRPVHGHEPGLRGRGGGGRDHRAAAAGCSTVA